jgi:hypothetical protein
MEHYFFKASEPSDYNDRSKKSQKINLLISSGIFVFVSLVSDWKYGLVISFIFFIVQYLKSSRWDKYFITFIEVGNEQIKIRYKEEREEKEIVGKNNDFNFKKEIAFNRTKTPYLGIYYKGSILIKQFEVGEWNEKKFDEVILNVS